MAQYQITVDSQLLQQLFLGNSKDSGVAKLLESVLNQVLQAQATEQLSAEPYERTDERQGLSERYISPSTDNADGNDHPSGASNPKWKVLDRNVCSLSAK